MLEYPYTVSIFAEDEVRLRDYEKKLRRESKWLISVVLIYGLLVVRLCVVYLVLLCLFIHLDDIL